MRRRLATVLSGTLALAALALVAAAQLPEPTLHIPVAPPTGRIVSPQGAPGVVGGGSGQNPTAIRQGQKLLPEPATAPAPTGGEPVFGTTEFGADRNTEERPDRKTEADDRLHYVEVFNPSVVPFKRMTVLDSVRDDYALYVRDHGLRQVRVGGQTSPDRDLFWASLLVDIRPDGDIAIPSVAPDMRILSYETEPAMRVEFEKDGADNFFVRAEDPAAGGRIRLVFLADAPATYFGAPVPKGKRVSDLAGSDHQRPLEPRAQRSAQLILEHLGLDRSTPLDVAVDSLVAYHRGFDAGRPPPVTDDIYLDLARSKRGVCRHRAFAFVVTANALGIPARFVANEAHAFVEIWLPDVEWLRVDLGGEALRLDVSNATNKTMHRPRREDSLPKPPGYADEYSTLEGDVRGLSQQQLDDSKAGPADPNGTGPGSGRGSATGTGPGTSITDPADPLSPAPGRGLPQAPKGAFPGKTETKTRVAGVDEVGYRGESVRVSGRVESKGAGVANVRVDLYFAPSGGKGDGARFVGQTMTGADGSFTLPVELPPDLALGKHEVFASTPGDARFGPSVSE
jgi:transglutaminase-like putative cysteine protease